MSSRRPPALGALMDDLLDLATVLVAWWSVLYWAFWAAGASLWVAGWVWAAGSVPILAAFWLLGRRSRRRAPTGSSSEGLDRGTTVISTGPPPALARPLVGMALLFGAGAALCSVTLPRGFSAMWLLLIVAVLCGGASVACRRGPSTATALGSARDHPAWQHVSMLCLALGVAVLSLFIHLPDLDDPYYLNRSVWIAERGTAAVRDTMFGPETYVAPYNGGIPIASIEGLIGVLSHMTGLEVGTLTWVVTTFLGAAMAVWALWLLARTWAPHAALTAAVVAVVFMLLSGESRLGNFWIARMWQGKVLAAAVLMPLIWVWATAAATSQRRRPLVMLALGGVAFAGLTSTSVILAPFMAGAMVATAVVLRSRRLALGGGLFLLGPLLSGAAVLLLSEDVGGRDPALLTGAETFLRVLGQDHVMVALVVLAMALGPLVVGHRVGALLVAWVTLASLVMLFPPLLRLANEVTGSGPILWRVLFAVPLTMLVGLLAVPAIPARLTARMTARSRQLLAAVPAVVVVVCVLAFGAPLWTTVDHNGPVTVSSRPSWKVDLAALQDVRDVMRTDPSGVILLPPNQMRILSMFTTQAFAVDPRDWYARTLAEPKPRNRYRLQLKTFAQSNGPLPDAETTRRALTTLDVEKVCLLEHGSERDRKRRDLLRTAGYGAPTQVGRLTCYRPVDR